MNRIFLTGNLTAAPELFETNAGKEFCKFNIAVRREYVDEKTGEASTDFFRCTAWGNQAHAIAKYQRKGNKLTVVGNIYANTFTDKDGIKRTNYEVQVKDVEFLTPKKDNAPEQTEKTAAQKSQKKELSDNEMLF